MTIFFTPGTSTATGFSMNTMLAGLDRSLVARVHEQNAAAWLNHVGHLRRRQRL